MFVYPISWSSLSYDIAKFFIHNSHKVQGDKGVSVIYRSALLASVKSRGPVLFGAGSALVYPESYTEQQKGEGENV